MTTQTATRSARTQPRGTQRPATFLDAVASEWIKIRTHRGVLLALLIGVGVTALAGANNTSANVRNILDGADAPGDLTGITQFGMKFGVIAFAVAGALAMTSEYSSGMIRTSLTAVPSRGRFLAAKAIAFTTVALVPGLIASTTSFVIGRSLLSGAGVQLDPTDPGVLRALVGGGLFLATSGLLALVLGALLRNPVATVGCVFALYVLPSFLGPELSRRIHPFEAGDAITRAAGGTAWSGYVILLAWTVVIAAGAYAAMRRRDA
ncbi:ABC transporter permease subunit [Streptomyces sp. NPDC098789]|uniref:ABC transporter permease subunit n=1 Tax=Streptomyces sp. NPDC098789 TaxID=3366098 RepID=UPI0037FA605D